MDVAGAAEGEAHGAAWQNHTHFEKTCLALLRLAYGFDGCAAPCQSAIGMIDRSGPCHLQAA